MFFSFSYIYVNISFNLSTFLVISSDRREPFFFFLPRVTDPFQMSGASQQGMMESRL